MNYQPWLYILWTLNPISKSRLCFNLIHKSCLCFSLGRKCRLSFILSTTQIATIDMQLASMAFPKGSRASWNMFPVHFQPFGAWNQQQNRQIMYRNLFYLLTFKFLMPSFIITFLSVLNKDSNWQCRLTKIYLIPTIYWNEIWLILSHLDSK